MDLMLDSGAVTTIMPADTFPGHKPKETEASRRGITYAVANGGDIKNKGELTVRGVASNGTRMNIIAQASDVTKPLGAAREIVKAGNRIVLDEDSSYIENKTTKKRIPRTRKNGMFVVTMRIPRGVVRRLNFVPITASKEHPQEKKIAKMKHAHAKSHMRNL